VGVMINRRQITQFIYFILLGSLLLILKPPQDLHTLLLLLLTTLKLLITSFKLSLRFLHSCHRSLHFFNPHLPPVIFKQYLFSHFLCLILRRLITSLFLLTFLILPAIMLIHHSLLVLFTRVQK
jgi:hypothetical protein